MEEKKILWAQKKKNYKIRKLLKILLIYATTKN